MDTPLQLKISDPYNIQLGNHFNDIILKYISVADSLNINANEKYENNLEEYPYIEARQQDYYGLIEALWNSGVLKRNMNIIDIGCGFGTTLYNIAHQFKHYNDAIGDSYFNISFTGIENDKKILKRWQYLENLWKPLKVSKEIKEADLKKGIDYKDYDLILTFHPLRENKEMVEAYKDIFNQMKKGAIFFEYMESGKGHASQIIELQKEFSFSIGKLMFGGKIQSILIKT